MPVPDLERRKRGGRLKVNERSTMRTHNESCVYVLLYVVGTRLALFLDRSWERDRE